MTLETDAKPEDVELLNKIKENLPQTTNQHKTITQRLEWTLNEITYHLKNPKDSFEEVD